MYSLRKVSGGLRMVSESLGKVSDGLRKVPDSLGKVSNGPMKVLDYQRLTEFYSPDISYKLKSIDLSLFVRLS